MVTRFKALNEESKSFVKSMLEGGYVHGECYAFAIALHRGLGWNMVADMKGNIPMHVGVRVPESSDILDARGRLTEEKFFGEKLSLDDRVRRSMGVDENTLYLQRPILDRSIEQARIWAEMLWPDLPWKESAFARVKVFLDDLEALSRKHKLWIRAPFPTVAPVISPGEDDEVGYVVEPIGTGRQFVFNRVLEFDPFKS